MVIEVPDEILEELLFEAERTGTSVRELALRKLRASTASVAEDYEHVQFPLIRSDKPGWLHLDNEKIAELCPFP